MTLKLARRLKSARLGLGLSIRDVQKISKNKITNAYVNQLENGCDFDPSPKKLRVLCRVLKLNYLGTLIVAGYITKRELRHYE